MTHTPKKGVKEVKREHREGTGQWGVNCERRTGLTESQMATYITALEGKKMRSSEKRKRQKQKDAEGGVQNTGGERRP